MKADSVDEEWDVALDVADLEEDETSVEETWNIEDFTNDEPVNNDSSLAAFPDGVRFTEVGLPQPVGQFSLWHRGIYDRVSESFLFKVSIFLQLIVY